jgi:hypothetical protein
MCPAEGAFESRTAVAWELIATSTQLLCSLVPL